MKDVRPQNVEEIRIIDANNRLKERVEAKRYKRIIKLNAFADKYEKLLTVLSWVIGGLIGYCVYKFIKYLFLLVIQ